LKMVSRPALPRKFNNLFSSLQLKEIPEDWNKNWEESQASFCPGKAAFLKTTYLESLAPLLGISTELEQVLSTNLQMFTDLPDLEKLIWHCYRITFELEDQPLPEIESWPVFSEELYPNINLFYAYLLLAGVNDLQLRHTQLGIPKQVIYATLADILVWIEDHRSSTGRWGLSQLGWLKNHFKGQLFHLGRLQFMFEKFQFHYHVFRNDGNGNTVVLAPDEKLIREDGQYEGANGITDPHNQWLTVYRETENEVHGNPVDARGWIKKTEIKLSLKDWKKVLSTGDKTIGIHIPATGSMDYQQCADSFSQAVDFFQNYFPDYGYQAFTCSSWLMDGQLAEYLPETSNISKFLTEFYLLPLPHSNSRQMYQRVFGGEQTDLSTVVPETSLQKCIIEHVQKGGHWRFAGGIFLREDIPWGKAIYRKLA